MDLFTDPMQVSVANAREKNMQEELFLKDSRVGDPYVDRRSGEERRQAYDSDYFADEGPERRMSAERRKQGERRHRCIRVSRWSSVCPE
jgi:hypothetical protein